MTDPLRSFYQHHPPDISAITDCTHRHFRILLPRGTFLKIPDRIRSGTTLQAWLVRYRPSDVYYSTSCWLAPENLGRREGTPLSDNIFLSADIVFDLDRAPFSVENLESAREDTLRLLAFCKNEGLPVRYIAFSGSKGFHVVCTDTVRYCDTNPRAREAMAYERRRKILSRVTAAGIAVDPRITPDTRRILRVPGTVNSKTGYVCTVLSEAELRQPAGEMLKYIKKVPLSAPQIPETGDESSLRGFRIISWLCHRIGVRSKPQPPCAYATFLTSAVPGIMRHVPFFVYPAHRNLEKIRADLVGLQRTYGLSDIFLFRSGTDVTGVCLRTFPAERLEKIHKASRATNTGTLLKYHQLFFRVGSKQDSDGHVIAGVPEYIGMIPAPADHNAHFVSLPHYRFLADFLPVPEYPRMHGEGAVFLTHTVIEE